MAIVIPSIITAELTAVRNTLLPVVDAVTHTSSQPYAPYLDGNRAADLLKLLTGLIDSGTLTATAGDATSVSDTTAFTGVNSLVGATVTFAGNVTAALAGVKAKVISNTVTKLNFAPGALDVAPDVGDEFTVEFTALDADIAILAGGKGLGDHQCLPYAVGPTFINAILKLLQLLGAAVPSYLTPAAGEPFHIGSPFAGAGSQGHGGGYLIADALLQAKNAVAAYTAPA
jgi:hypothetical protein